MFNNQQLRWQWLRPRLALRTRRVYPWTGGPREAADTQDSLRWSWSGLVALMFLVSAGGAQSTKSVGLPSCATCRIEMESILVIGANEPGQTLPGDVLGMTRDGRGRYYVLLDKQGEMPMVFDSTGRFLTALGRQGQGPGEYIQVGAIVVGANDTLFVFDRGGARMTVLDHTFRVVRTAPMPYFITRATMTVSGLLVVNANIQDTAHAGFPFHAFDRVGNVRGSFGAVTRSLRPQDAYFMSRILAPAAAGGVWSIAVRGAYQIERWLPDGRLAEVLTRQPSWFVTPPTPPRPISPDNPLPTIGRAMWEDATGLLWVTRAVSAPGFARGFRRTPSGAWDLVDMGVGYDGHFEVIDAKTGRLVAERTFDQAFHFALGNGLFGSRTESSQGGALVRVWRVELRRKPLEEVR